MSEDATLTWFETMYHATNDDLLRYFLRRTDAPEDAADLLAEVYVVAWRSKDRLPPADERRLWLFGIARNLLAAHRRRAVRSRGLSDALGAALSRRLATISAPEDAAAVTAALATLSPDDREVIQLTAWEGLTPAQIAIVTGRLPGAVRVQLHRARARLRRALDSADAGDPGQRQKTDSAVQTV
jgi:RNA polymerase sigma-70 factor (ECF subfamily)